MATIKTSKPTSTIKLEVQYGTDSLKKQWSARLTKPKLLKWIQAAVQKPTTITLRMVGLAESKKINFQFRAKDYPTNILTFDSSLNHDTSEIIETELLICLPIITKEAKEQGKDVLAHFIHILIHGLLHAQGFDHEDEEEAVAMEFLEISILQSLNISNPYDIG
ncbi:MAG: rRNA maturation RNase YbeY [Betaproteobacteria bacterium]|jgi:probable rRNA maturation factor